MNSTRLELETAIAADLGGGFHPFRALGADLGLVAPGNTTDAKQERREDAEKGTTQDSRDRRPATLGCGGISHQCAEQHETHEKLHRVPPNEASVTQLAALLLALGRAGIELAPHPSDPARLRHRPADLPPDLSERVRLHKPAILGLLAGLCGPEPHGDAGYTLAERLGVAEELGLPTHPGSPAWLVAVGESLEQCCESTTRAVG